MMGFVFHKNRLLLSTAALAGLIACPAFAQQAASQSNELTLDEIVVTGVRGSLTRSVEAKRNATTIVDTISAEEIGKFPDRNVADALSNIPGITIGRGRGAEGQDVSIRGLGDIFSITTLNDRILATDQQSRAFQFDVLPSEMISGAEVRKASQASVSEGSIGGAINLKSARPFDHNGLHMSGAVEGDYGDLSKKAGFKASGVISSTFADDTIGLLFSAVYSRRDIRTDNLREYSPAAQSELDQETDFNANGVIDEDGKQYIWPQFYSVGTVLGKRERLGLSGALQYRPVDTIKITIDGLYSHYNASTKNYAQSNFLNPRNDVAEFDSENPLLGLKWRPGTVKADSNGVITNFTIDDLVAEVLTYEEPRKVDTYQIGGNIEWSASERLKLNLDAYRSQATRNGGGKERFVVAGIPGATGVFATRANGLPDLAITLPGGRALTDATDADYRAHFIGIFGTNLQDRITGLKLDGTFDADVGIFKSLQFGANFTNRSKRVENFDNSSGRNAAGEIEDTSCNFCGYPFSFGAIGASVIRPLPVSNLLRDQAGNFPRGFASFDIDTYLNALPKSDNNPAILDPNTGEPYPEGHSTQLIGLNQQASYKIREKNYAGYIQFNFESDKWRGDIGGRLVHTNVNSTGAKIDIVSITKIPGNTADFDVVITEPTPITGGGKYTEFLPSANFAYDFSDKIRLRMAASQVISRPSFDQLSSAFDASSAKSGTFAIFYAGNPNLKPITANQLDASLEYYFAPRSYVSIAVFHKSIKNFITSVTTEEVIANQNFTVTRVVNGDSAKVSGLEVSGQYLLENGFGAQANFTYNHSRAKLGGITGKLDGAIPYSFNLKAFYEGQKFNAQISYSYASKFTSLISGFIPGLAEEESAYQELSAGVGYNILPKVKIFVEASNLLNAKTQRFNTYNNVPQFYESSGRSLFFGVRAHY
jgi:iron complex outermembrane recepter protein